MTVENVLCRIPPFSDLGEEPLCALAGCLGRRILDGNLRSTGAIALEKTVTSVMQLETSKR
jgi:hypothetical protein